MLKKCSKRRSTTKTNVETRSAPGRPHSLWALGLDRLAFQIYVEKMQMLGALWETTTVKSDGKNKTEIYTWKVEKQRWSGEATCFIAFDLLQNKNRGQSAHGAPNG